MNHREHLGTRLLTRALGVVSNVPRCHAVGGSTASLLILTIAWVWSHNSHQASSIQMGDAEVDLHDAVALIKNADRWHELRSVNLEKSQSMDRRAAAIYEWLPSSVDWKNTEDDIRDLGNSADLHVRELEQQDEHVGTRVGVVAVTCRVEGTFASLCRFIHALSERDRPIACSEIQLNRLTSEDETEAGVIECTATLTLRIPFAAAGSAASQLSVKDIDHAS